MGYKIKNITIDGNVVLAPMAGVSNIAYRKMCKKYHAAMVTTEMISDKGIFYKDKKTLDMARIDENEHPIAIQIFGGSIDTLLYAAKWVDTQSNADIIDINMGCPVPKVIKSNSGSDYLKDVNRIYNTVKTIVENVKKPVTVKIRIGWDHQSINVFEVCDAIIAAGASAITIHGRTKSDLYSGKVDYDLIRQVKEKHMDFPIIANGDIKTPLEAKQILEYTHCDAIMIGRASYGNPYIFKQIDHYLKKNELLKDMDLSEKIDILKEYAKDLIRYKGEVIAIKELRGQAGWFVKNCPNGAKIRNELTSIKTYQELETILNNINFKSDI
ncbi:MAG: tRNA dihydrouridine synthase DusB [Erysipelotrichaceae bacterium]|nr:tRNA dihydrouridine synthase DusB [Erysipelotrichaceae bacterium]